VADSQRLTDAACDMGRDAACDPRPVLGLGCMRLSTDADRDEERGLATLAAALDAGVTVLDTARAYGRGEADLGHNERLIARALAAVDPARRAGIRVVTKGGMSRAGGAWTPDGRARTLRADAAASAEALGRPPDVWLLHAPDPRVPLATSLRAMAAILDAGEARAVGLSNVGRAHIEEALAIVPVAAVEVAIGPRTDVALRGGVVALCAERGIELLVHTPLGGVARAASLADDPVLAAVAAARGATAAQVMLAWLRALAPRVVPLPGARRPETARAAAVAIDLDGDARAQLDVRFPAGALARPRPPAPPPPLVDGEVVLIMGIPGAGKTRAVAAYTERGYQRFNRDERGGDLRGLAAALEAALAGGARRVVLDNTYTTRAQRADVLAVAARHGLAVRGLWLDTPAAAAQVNLCARYVAAGGLPGPDELRRSKVPGVMPPTSHMRVVRGLEPPAADEGFAALEVVPFVRASGTGSAGRVIAVDAFAEHVVDATPTLAIGWRPDGEPAPAADGIDVAVCTHAGGPPVCWCRPPLPGLVVAWAARRGVDLARLTVVGPAPTFRTLARALGAAWQSR
jgi:aryl-alcohol dehydrogenase-like predicted oxidoreductase